MVANGYLERTPIAGGERDKYTQQIVSAVIIGSSAISGIIDDGVIGPETLEAINIGPAARARATAVALERLRWLARDPAPTRIDVNIAAAELSYWRDDKLVDQRKVIVGQPGKETPHAAGADVPPGRQSDLDDPALDPEGAIGGQERRLSSRAQYGVA